MTPLQSTISEIDFKLRLIVHFKKVYGKCEKFPSTQTLMADQTIRTLAEVKTMIGDDQSVRTKAIKLVKKYDLKDWIDMVRKDYNVRP